MYDPDNGEERYAYNHLMNVVLIFNSEDERLAFEDYIIYNYEEFKERLDKTDRYDHIKTDSERRTEVYREELNTGFVLNEMLAEYRKEYSNL